MIDFLKTPAGKRFFDRDFPNLIKALNRVGAALEDSNEAQPLKDYINQLGISQEGRIFPQPRMVCTSDPIMPKGMTRATDPVEAKAQDMVAQMEPILDKMKAEGIAVDQKTLARLRTEVAEGPKGPMGYKPLKLDESDITSAPNDGKRRALYLALDNWIQTCPTERAQLVEQLRNEGSMPAQRASTILALFVQFEDALREALLDEPGASASKPEPA